MTDTTDYGNGGTVPAAPIEVEPVTKETWEAESAERFSAAVTSAMAELEIVSNHAESGTFSTTWRADTVNYLRTLGAAMTKTRELLATGAAEKRAKDPATVTDNVVLIQSGTTH